MLEQVVIDYLEEEPVSRDALFETMLDANAWLDSRYEFDDMIDDLIARETIMEIQGVLVKTVYHGVCQEFEGTLRFEGKEAYPIVELESGDPIKISTDSTACLIAGDKVLVKISSTNEIVNVVLLEQRPDHIIGTVSDGILTPISERLGKKCFLETTLPNGSLVIARVVSRNENGVVTGLVMAQPYPEAAENAVGAICTEFGIDQNPEKIEIPFLPAHQDNRVDLTDTLFVTIDGSDSKDFDDAICVKQTDSGWRLLVAIADVTHYVRYGSPLDVYALLKATSVYFPDLCIPMLPEALSNDLCSLVEGSDRLVMVADIFLGKKGGVQETYFYSGVINSKKRMTYSSVEAILTTPGSSAETPEITSMLLDAQKCARALSRLRKNKGAIEFDSAPRMESQKLIEEFMLAANTAVAVFLSEHPLTKGYGFTRHHKPPTPENMGRAALNIRLNGTHTHYSGFDEMIPALAKHKDPEVRSAVQHAMSRARYVADPTCSHYALGEPLYTHYTSPIRRYPDIIVHRLLKLALGIETSWVPEIAWLCQVAEWCSYRSAIADKAESAIKKRLALQTLIDDNIDQVEGLVVNNRFGNCLVKLFAYEVTGQIKDECIPIGTKLQVKIRKVDLLRRRLDLYSS